MPTMSLRASFYRFLLLFLAFILILFLSFSPFIQAQEILPLNQIKPGDKGYGLTVFRGIEAEKFDFDVVDIHSTWDDHYYILVLLSGGPKDSDGNEIIKEAAVLQGMSGSPLYIKGRVIGAIAAAPTFQKKSYALVTPIELMVGFRPEVVRLPNKLIQEPPSTRFLTLEPAINEINAGEMYAFCDYWGSSASCGGGTVTLAFPQNKNFLFTLGHRANPAGVTALPFWKARVLASIPQQSISSKIIEPIGPMLGTVFLESPYGQAAKLGIMPKFFEMDVVLENYFSRKMVSQYFFAYTPRTNGNIASVIMRDVQLIDRLLDVDAEVRIDTTGLAQIYYTGATGTGTTVGSVVKMLTEEDLNPVVENIRITLKTRPKYKTLELQKATLVKTERANDKIALEFSIVAVGDEEWTSKNLLVLDQKYLDKELHITSGDELAAKILPYLKPKPESVELLNKISDRNALYVYYADPEKVKPNESPVLNIQLIFGSSVTKPPNIDAKIPATASNLSLDELPVESDEKRNVWTSKPIKYEIEILAKIELPDNAHLIKGEVEFTPKVAEQKIKNKKKFWIF
ncbi:MAG: hypothetical protein HYT61_02390 [Candidatus Yanofskybacteria bacterium]|nr:hypothetical protein [Candidatus Yanofskybacteria bacterium]